VAALHITTHSSTSITSNRTSDPNKMTAHLRKSKTVLLDHMKTLPDAHIATEEDFVTWGQQFVNAVVSHI
jgi:hypothetical protein